VLRPRIVPSEAPPSALPAALVLALSVLGAGLAGVLALSFLASGPSFCGPGCIDRRMDALVASDGRVNPSQASRARDLIRRRLELSPFDDGAWLRLAALEVETAGVFTPAARAAVETSYRYAPVDAAVARWRLAFVFEHWREVTPSIRKSAEMEMRSLGVWVENRRMLAELERQIADPTGRLAFHLLRQSLG
jgi:hypothetical protein